MLSRILFLFFLSFFSLSFILWPFTTFGVSRERERERTSRCCTCVMGPAIDSQFFLQENNIESRRRKTKILLTSFVCFGSAPAIRPRCDEFNAFEWGGPSTFFPPPPFYWSLLVRGITHRHEQLCCVWWSYPLRQEGLRSNGNIFHFQLLNEFLKKKEKTYRLNDEENDPVFIKQKKIHNCRRMWQTIVVHDIPEQQQQQQLVRFYSYEKRKQLCCCCCCCSDLWLALTIFLLSFILFSFILLLFSHPIRRVCVCVCIQHDRERDWE